MPERIQLSRAKGWRMPPNTIKVDRSSRYGNPFTPSMICASKSKVHKQGEPIGQAGAVKAFTTLMRANLRLEPAKTRMLLEQLRGKNLACWCKAGEPCPRRRAAAPGQRGSAVVSTSDLFGVAPPQAMVPCISILQPWAWLIVNGHKPVENRTWPTKYRGRILIHAGKTLTRDYYASVLADLVDEFGCNNDSLPDLPAFELLARGGIVGEAVITDCVTRHQSPYFFGPYGFVMAEPKAYPQVIPYRGMLGIFGVPESVVGSA